jgi:hypothetical protein
MKGLKRWGMALAIFVAMTGISRAAVTEEPVILPDSLLTVTVSDLHGFIDGLGGVAAQVNPMMNGMMIKGQLGMMLGDPGLMGIAPGKGLAVVMLNETNIVGFIEVSEAQSAAYVAKVSGEGMKARYTDGLLIAGDSDALIERGVALVPAVRASLLAKRSPALRVGLQPAMLVAQKNDDIEGMLGMMPMMMGMGMAQTPGIDAGAVEGLTRVLEGEMRFLLSVSSQCEAAEVILAPVNGAIRLDQVFKAKPGSRLAALLAAPKVSPSNPALQSGVLGEAAIALDATLSNPDALTSYFVEEMEAVTQAMGVSADEMTGWLSVMKKWMGIYGGSFCESISFGGDSFVNASYLMEVKNEAAALEGLKTMSADMAPFLSLYKGLGMPLVMEFKEAVREHKGIKIHQIEMKFLVDQMPASSGAQLQAIGLENMLYDVAVFDGKMLYAMGGSNIETLIDRVKDSALAPTPLKARSVYPAGGFYYCDADMAKYLSGLASVMPADPNNPLPQFVAMMQGAEPVTSAGFSEGGVVMWSANIPGSLVAKIGQAAMMMQMQ